MDQSNRQVRMHPAFKLKVDWSNPRTMSSVVDIQSVRGALRRIMAEKGVKPTTLSLKVGTNRTLVKDLLEKTNDINISTLSKLAGALDVPVADLVASPRVPVAGYIGAGGVIIFEDLEGGTESVMCPPGVTSTLIALVVRGDSMLPKYNDGDVIYIQRDRDGIEPEYIGDDCAVRLRSGETYIKQLMRGSGEGRFTLISLNAPPIENVEIEWATPVRFILPARSRHLFS